MAGDDAFPGTGPTLERAARRAAVPGPVTHGLTIDLEDWSDTQAVRLYGPHPSPPPRIQESTPLVLELLARHGVRGTFFILGRIAASRPALVRRIAAAGHRIGSHGFSHRPIGELGPTGLRRELTASRAALEDAAGMTVEAHRCPSWSLRPGTLWALPIIADCGFRVDASLSPGGTPFIGTPGVPRAPHRVRLADGRALREFPLGVGAVWPRMPFSGGFFLRTLPPAWTEACLLGFEHRGVPAVLYAHPWEFDPGTPRVRLPQPWGFMQHHGLERMTERFGALLARHRFAPLEELCAGIDWDRTAVWRAETDSRRPRSREGTAVRTG